MSNYAYGRKGRSEEYSHNAWSLTEPPATPESPLKSRKFSLSRLSKRQKLWGGITLLLVIIGAITGIAVGVTVGKDKASHVVCEGNSTGAACNLDATCVFPNLNSLFNANFTPATLSTAVWEAQGAPSSSNCAQQAILVDVAPALDSVASPNRTLWAQSALLWNLAESVDLNGTAHLQQFVLDADWHTLVPTDGPTTTSASQFSTTISGYEFNFAAQTVVAPPATFETEGQPSQAQIDQVDDSTKTALDRMYTYASASSTQQKQALSQYWTGVLQQKSSDLNTFVSTIRGAPILLPFDATNESLANLLTNPSTSPFPPPLACYPGLSSDQLQKINSIETSIFGLPPAQAQTTFDTSCFASRPIYGTLNILQLRLPFLDGRQGAAKQAAVLEPDAYSRAIIYSGEVLSAMPGSSSPNPPVSDPRQYGTLNNLNHVLLQYLKSISDVNDAIALVEFVLGQTPPIVPPGDTTLLYTALSSLPSLEIAILGSVGPSDISSTVSSFSDLSGKLFFGSTDSLDLRTWTINTNQAPHTVAWAELATSPEVVRDDSLTDDTFNTIWNSSFTFFHTNNTANVQVSNITTGFQALGLFNP
ncbi:hypothetical protein EW026_g3799 [Hermanssonia centrifuga]|uniref:Uncharacterized protein n=1 Tax=Hermanssonia centrifuga TaxID=98765 RepID=A0A4S4KK63_9APHY|nr:hypothetical protein EW026_g3799 [Hermanssonia centrifuga]